MAHVEGEPRSAAGATAVLTAADASAASPVSLPALAAQLRTVEAELAVAAGKIAGVDVGLGRIVALYCRPSTLYYCH